MGVGADASALLAHCSCSLARVLFVIGPVAAAFVCNRHLICSFKVGPSSVYLDCISYTDNKPRSAPTESGN